MYTCMYVCMYVCKYVCVYVCVCISLSLSIYIYIYIYTYTFIVRQVVPPDLHADRVGGAHGDGGQDTWAVIYMRNLLGWLGLG